MTSAPLLDFNSLKIIFILSLTFVRFVIQSILRHVTKIYSFWISIYVLWILCFLLGQINEKNGKSIEIQVLLEKLAIILCSYYSYWKKASDLFDVLLMKKY